MLGHAVEAAHGATVGKLPKRWRCLRHLGRGGTRGERAAIGANDEHWGQGRAHPGVSFVLQEALWRPTGQQANTTSIAWVDWHLVQLAALTRLQLQPNTYARCGACEE